MFTHTLDELPNGMPVLRVSMPGVKSVTAMIFANTGSRFEKPNEEGIAHFLEHMVFKGTKKYPDPQLLASTIDSIGADFNAFTSKEFTGYYVKTASEHLEVALDVLSEMLLQPLLKQEDIERERGVIIEEINMYEDSPMRMIGNIFERMFFKGSGLSHDVIGNKETVSQVQRADFVQFMQQWYGPGNLVLVLAGDENRLHHPDMLQLVSSAFQKTTDLVRAKDKVRLSRYLPEKTPVSVEQLELKHKQTEQAHLVMGWPSISRTDDRRYTQSLLAIILGGNMSSRLFTEIREKRGLCYYIHADDDYYHDAGYFTVLAGVDPKRLHEALETIQLECTALASGERTVSEEELQRAKDYAVGTMILGLEDSRRVAEYFASKKTLQDVIADPNEAMQRLKSVSVADIQAFAREVIDLSQTRLSIIGPFKDESEFYSYIGKERK